MAAALILFLLTVLVGSLPPLLFQQWRKRQRRQSAASGLPAGKGRALTTNSNKWLSYDSLMKMLMFLGGGVLLATCFIHLMPEVRENLHHYLERQEAREAENGGSNSLHNETAHEHDQHEGHHDDADEEEEEDHHLYLIHEIHEPHSHDHGGDQAHHHSHGIPAVELAICVGFFLIYLLEEIVHSLIPHHHHHHHQESGHEGKNGGKVMGSKDRPERYTRNSDFEETSFHSNHSQDHNGNSNGSIHVQAVSVSLCKSVPIAD